MLKMKTIRLSRIKISKAMQNNPPRPEKLIKKYSFYRFTNEFSSPIIIDSKHNLIDGYTSYLLARMFGMKKVDVTIE